MLLVSDRTSYPVRLFILSHRSDFRICYTVGLLVEFGGFVDMRHGRDHSEHAFWRFIWKNTILRLL